MEGTRLLKQQPPVPVSLLLCVPLSRHRELWLASPSSIYTSSPPVSPDVPPSLLAVLLLRIAR